MFRCLLPKNELFCQQAIITAIKTSHTSMYVPSFVRIERGSMGDHDLKLKKGHLYAQRPVNINFLSSADPKLALVPASRYDCHIKELYLNVCAKFHFNLKRFRWGPNTSY